MTSIRAGYEGRPERLARAGASLPVQIGLDLSFHPDSGVRPQLPDTLYSALIDTGANINAIDLALAESMALPMAEQQNIAGVHGRQETNLYLAQIYIPALDFTIHGQLAGVSLSASGMPYEALLGRPFLRYFTMTYDGPTGLVTLSR